METCKPGQIIQRDFRLRSHLTDSRPVRFLQWNIERGYKLDKIIEEIKEVDADIIALQEIDVGCERSGCHDTGALIAEALNYNYAFFCEFEELLSPYRDAKTQGGGVHGNGFLTRYDMSELRTVQHSFHPVDWDDPSHPRAVREPRRGRRAVLAAVFHAPQGPILCYNLHLEVFCGMLARMAQFADVLRDSKQQIDKGFQRQAILGDLNTMAHGIARLSPAYCTDRMRFLSLGQYEAAIWHHSLLSVIDPRYSTAAQGREGSSGTDPPLVNLGNPKLRALGLSPEVCVDALNPGFRDPFHPVLDVTLDNADYRLLGVSLMKGKLDWLMLREMEVLSTDLGNHDYSRSDHKWLRVDATF